MGSTTFGERVRAKAYALWEADGSMEGCADEYWQKARRIVEEEIAAEGAPNRQAPAVLTQRRIQRNATRGRRELLTILHERSPVGAVSD